MAIGLPEMRMRGAFFALFHPLVQFIAEGVYHLGVADGVVVERDLRHEQGILTADWDRVVLTQIV
jgi:hypothetical protein